MVAHTPIYAFLEISTSRWRLVFVRPVSESRGSPFFSLDTDGIEFVKAVVKPLFNVSWEIISLPLMSGRFVTLSFPSEGRPAQQ